MPTINKYLLALGTVLAVVAIGSAQNPIVPNRGLNDPHIHIFNDTAYVYASHDKSADNRQFIMEDWWVWSSPDLVNWKLKSVLRPEETYLGRPFTGCWATDVGRRNGKYYWYFSEKNQQAGVVVGDTPTGPWQDPLGRPLLTSDLTPTDEYDMAIFEEEGEHYIIFGVWEYYIARLSDDMISLAEDPKPLVIHDAAGPYGKGKTDDKPFVHKYGDRYYLSWGCFYAMADNLYGPYQYIGTVINADSFAEGYAAPTWPHGFLQGRHGSFFEWHNQWYYAYCDISQTGNRYFRDTFISYIHYKKNGEMAPIRVDGVGVGRYEPLRGPIEAEDYFAATGWAKDELAGGGFQVCATTDTATLYYPNIEAANSFSQLYLRLNSGGGRYRLQVRRGTRDGQVLAEATRRFRDGSSEWALSLPALSPSESLYVVVQRLRGTNLCIDQLTFTNSGRTTPTNR